MSDLPTTLRFCAVCQSYMLKDTSLGRVWWTCTACRFREAGAPGDALVASSAGAGHLGEMQDINSIYDPAVCRVPQTPPCPACGRDYMARTVVLGAVVTNRCFCGRSVQ